jgi:hypothetical protein
MEIKLSRTEASLDLVQSETAAQKNLCIHRGIPILSLVNAILMVIPATFLLQDALANLAEGATMHHFLDVNIVATTSIAIFVAVFQALVSTVILVHYRVDMKRWYTSHIAIAAVLAMISVFSFCNGIHRSYTGFTFTYTCILDSAFSLGLSILLMLPE